LRKFQPVAQNWLTLWKGKVAMEKFCLTITGLALYVYEADPSDPTEAQA